MSHRPEKFASTLKHTLAQILLCDLDNPLLKTVSVTSVTVTGDLQSARIMVSSYSEGDSFLAELDKAKGIIKQLLAKKMFMRYIPELNFIKDMGFVMDLMLSKLSKESKHE